MRSQSSDADPVAIPFDGWDVDPTGQELTIWWSAPGPWGKLRIFTAEERNEVHVLVRGRDGVGARPAWAGALPEVPLTQTLRLASPIGHRKVVDESSGELRPRSAPPAAEHPGWSPSPSPSPAAPAGRRPPLR